MPNDAYIIREGGEHHIFLNRLIVSTAKVWRVETMGILAPSLMGVDLGADRVINLSYFNQMTKFKM